MGCLGALPTRQRRKKIVSDADSALHALSEQLERFFKDQPELITIAVLMAAHTNIGSAGQTQCGGSGGYGAKGRSLHHRTASAPAQSSADGPLEHATIDLTDDEHVAVTAAIKLAIEATPAPNVKLNARIAGSRRIGEPFDPLAPRTLGSRRRSKRSRTPHVPLLTGIDYSGLLEGVPRAGPHQTPAALTRVAGGAWPGNANLGEGPIGSAGTLR